MPSPLEARSATATLTFHSQFVIPSQHVADGSPEEDERGNN